MNVNRSQQRTLDPTRRRAPQRVRTSFFPALLRVTIVTTALLRCLVGSLIRYTVARVRVADLDLNKVGESLARTFENLGGAYLKIGQILSTRRDILAEELVMPLQRLQDSVPPFPAEEALSIVECALGQPADTLFSSFDPTPIGSASIAQVHRAVLRDSLTEVAVKIRRPGIDRTVRIDSRVFMTLLRGVSLLPYIRGVPLLQAGSQIMDAIQAQTDFCAEAERHRQFFTLFEEGKPVRVPRLVDSYCAGDVLVMEYFDQLVKITALELDPKVHRTAVVAGLRGLYTMLFVSGLVHCDLHPGNILVGRNGEVVLLDFGFSTVMLRSERVAFARFFLSIAFADGATAARIVLETALRVPPNLNRTDFDRDIGELVRRASGSTAGEFLVASFVTSLFEIQRRHAVYGSPDFTMAILSLMVYEGIIRHRCSDLDFQREAIPALMLSLKVNIPDSDPRKEKQCLSQ